MKDGTDGENGGSVSDRPTPVRQWLWSLLWPRLSASWTVLASPDATAVLAIVFLNMARVVAVYKLTMNTRAIGFNVFGGKRSTFYPLLCKQIFWHVLEAAIDGCGKYLTSSLALLFRTKLTHMLQNKYYRKARFYHIENRVKNVDTIIVDDVRSIATGYAEYYAGLMDAGLRGVIFGSLSMAQQISQFGVLVGIPLTLMPLAHIYGSRKAVDIISPLDWAAFGALSTAKGNYRSQQTRLVVHGEAISALRGGVRERTILRHLFDEIVVKQRVLYDSFAQHLSWSSAFMQYGLHVTLLCGITAPNVFDVTPSSLRMSTLQRKRGNLNYTFMLTLQVLSASWNLIQQTMSLDKLEGEGSRIRDLANNLDQLESDDAEHNAAHIVHGNRIAFDGVDVATPTGNLLVKNLTFSLESGNDSLLLTGHNGSGKSSIFRCLAGLWSIREGTITKPFGCEWSGSGSDTEDDDAFQMVDSLQAAGVSLTNTVFYLPQKPYNVIGTLFDQLMYPNKPDTNQLSTKRARTILKQVGLEYLADRDGVFHTDVNWEETLSLGEKQCLAIARLVYHRPRFAILDECTSGVSTVMEKQLYYRLNEMGVSYITISHRPMLESLHCKRLCLAGNAEKSYEYTVLRTREELRHSLQAARDQLVTPTTQHGDEEETGDDEVDQNATLSRDEKCTHLVRTPESALWSAMRDLRSLLSKGVPVKCYHFVLWIVLGSVTKAVLLTWRNMHLQTVVMRAVVTSNGRAWLYATAGYLLNAALLSYVDYCTLSWHCTLQSDIYTSLTEQLMAKYVSKAGYYSLKTVEQRIDDPETRISDDVGEFAEKFTQLQQDILEPALKIIFFGVQLGRVVGRRGLLMYGYMAGAAFVLTQAMPDFKSLAARKSKRVGAYKFSQSLVRIHGESIAFFGGGDKEKTVAKERYQHVVDLEQEQMRSDLWFGWLKSMLGHRITDIVSQTLQFLTSVDAVVQWSADDALSASDIQSAVIGANGEVRDAVLHILNHMDKLYTLFGLIQRLSDFERALDETALPPFLSERTAATHSLMPPPQAPTSGNSSSSDELVIVELDVNPVLEISRLDLVTPSGVCLAKDVHVRVDREHRLQITGPNAAGKTSLVRIIAGLWRPSGSTHISIHGGEVAVVPQKMYSVHGSLLDQVTYPVKIDAKVATEALLEKARVLLELVGISYLVDRDGGWHAEQKFEDVLSLGEQQRLGMARLFFRNPAFAILDECTDAVSVDVEKKLYAAAAERGIICITVSKRLVLNEFHDQELRLGPHLGPNGCKLVKVS
jgi:ABC-type uncharacterized transport system fused permease/ATPase subunit